MSFRFLWLITLAAACSFLAHPGTARAAMVISYNANSAYLSRSSAGFFEANYGSTSFPTSHLLDASSGEYYSRIQLEYSQSSSGETLSSDLSQKREGQVVFGDYANAESVTNFSVTTNTTYNVTGFLNILDSTTAGYVYLETYLYDMTSSIYLIQNQQESRNTLNEAPTVGGTGGDSFNLMFGNVTGNLIAGHSYQFIWRTSSMAYPDTDGGAVGDGNITLTIGDGGAVAAVPEPASIAMWGAAALGMMVVRRRRNVDSGI